MSERAQIGIVWWALALTTIYGLTLGFLLHMIPPPDATMSIPEIGRWYADHQASVKIGATIASWCSGFMLPLWVVIGIQIARQETGRPIWAVMAVAGGSMMSIFLALPPLFFGAAAFTTTRLADVTANMHELGVLTLISTDQFFVFAWVAVCAISLRPQIAPHSPFPRWFGYLSMWITLMIEAGAVCFNFRTGPFSWKGVLAFWMPLSVFGAWIGIMAFLLLRALRAQRQDALDAQPLEVVPA